MKTFFRKIRRAASFAADMFFILLALLEEGVNNHVSETRNRPPY